MSFRLLVDQLVRQRKTLAEVIDIYQAYAELRKKQSNPPRSLHDASSLLSKWDLNEIQALHASKNSQISPLPVPCLCPMAERFSRFFRPTESYPAPVAVIIINPVNEHSHTFELYGYFDVDPPLFPDLDAFLLKKPILQQVLNRTNVIYCCRQLHKECLPGITFRYLYLDLSSCMLFMMIIIE